MESINWTPEWFKKTYADKIVSRITAKWEWMILSMQSQPILISPDVLREQPLAEVFPDLADNVLPTPSYFFPLAQWKLFSRTDYKDLTANHISKWFLLDAEFFHICISMTWVCTHLLRSIMATNILLCIRLTRNHIFIGLIRSFFADTGCWQSGPGKIFHYSRRQNRYVSFCMQVKVFLCLVDVAYHTRSGNIAFNG